MSRASNAFGQTIILTMLKFFKIFLINYRKKGKEVMKHFLFFFFFFS